MTSSRASRPAATWAGATNEAGCPSAWSWTGVEVEWRLTDSWESEATHPAISISKTVIPNAAEGFGRTQRAMRLGMANGPNLGRKSLLIVVPTIVSPCCHARHGWPHCVTLRGTRNFDLSNPKWANGPDS